MAHNSFWVYAVAKKKIPNSAVQGSLQSGVWFFSIFSSYLYSSEGLFPSLSENIFERTERRGEVEGADVLG